MSGGSSGSSLLGAGEFTARKLARAFRQATDDHEVRAILFRIDSPGGSAVASETIWREVVRARERGKPVIVSMGDAAGSGGYYIAAPADKVWAADVHLTPDGKYLYATERGTSTIQQYKVDAKTGMLTANGSVSLVKVSTGCSPLPGSVHHTSS